MSHPNPKKAPGERTKRRPSTYVGIDLHKKTLQVEIQDSKGSVISNRKIKNTPLPIRKKFVQTP